MSARERGISFLYHRQSASHQSHQSHLSHIETDRTAWNTIDTPRSSQHHHTPAPGLIALHLLNQQIQLATEPLSRTVEFNQRDGLIEFTL